MSDECEKSLYEAMIASSPKCIEVVDPDERSALMEVFTVRDVIHPVSTVLFRDGRLFANKEQFESWRQRRA